MDFLTYFVLAGLANIVMLKIHGWDKEDVNLNPKHGFMIQLAMEMANNLRRENPELYHLVVFVGGFLSIPMFVLFYTFKAARWTHWLFTKWLPWYLKILPKWIVWLFTQNIPWHWKMTFRNRKLPGVPNTYWRNYKRARGLVKIHYRKFKLQREQKTEQQ